MVVAGLVAWSTPLCAQPLGDLAKRAAERRSDAATPAVKITEKDLPATTWLDTQLRDYALNQDNLFQYITVRGMILDARTRDRDLDRFFLKAEREGRDPVVESAAMPGSAVLRMLDFEKMPLRTYVLTEAAYRRALGDASLPDIEIDRLHPVRSANARFVRTQDIQIRNAISYHWERHERWLEAQRGWRE